MKYLFLLLLVTVNAHAECTVDELTGALTCDTKLPVTCLLRPNQPKPDYCDFVIYRKPNPATMAIIMQLLLED